MRIKIKKRLQKSIVVHSWPAEMYELIGKVFEVGFPEETIHGSLRFKIDVPNGYGTWSIPAGDVEIIDNSTPLSYPVEVKKKKKKSKKKKLKLKNGTQVWHNGDLVTIDCKDKDLGVYYDDEDYEIRPDDIEEVMDKPFKVAGEIVNVIDGEIYWNGESVSCGSIEEFVYSPLEIDGNTVEFDGCEGVMDLIHNSKWMSIGCQEFKTKHFLKLVSFLEEYGLI